MATQPSREDRSPLAAQPSAAPSSGLSTRRSLATGLIACVAAIGAAHPSPTLFGGPDRSTSARAPSAPAETIHASPSRGELVRSQPTAGAVPRSQRADVPAGGIAGAPPACGDDTLTQSSSPAVIEPGASIVCASLPISLDTSLARSFTLGAPFTVGCVTFGIDTNVGGAWPVEVRLLVGAIEGPYDGLMLLAETAVEIPAGASGTLHVATFPGGVPVQAGTSLVVELLTPSRLPSAGGDGGFIALGCNDDGQEAPTFVRATGCGVEDFIPTADVGFPGSHVAMTLASPGGQSYGCDPRGPGCFGEHASPGCSDPACCNAVCALDPSCCLSSWDADCVDIALTLCIGCSPDCTSALMEDEPCGTDANNGCHGSGQFGDIYCGKPLCGDLWVSDNGATFDVDWYTLDLSHVTGIVQVSLSVSAEMPVDCYLVEPTCADPKILAEGSGACPTTLTACVAPGVYRVLLAPAVTDGYPCGSASRAYRVDLSCELATDICCDNDSLPTTSKGDPILPDEWDGGPYDLIDIDEDRGLVSDLYPNYDTSLDLWYADLPCDLSIGEELAEEDDEFDLAAELAKEGIFDDPDLILEDLEDHEVAVAAQTMLEGDGFPSAGPVGLGPWAPTGAHCPRAGEHYVFGGRDIILIHGLRLEHLVDRFVGVPGAEADWAWPSAFPASAENPQFYSGGYFKGRAEDNWSDYVENFLEAHNAKNRYLVVCYASTQRLEWAVHAVLTQISDAMRYGTGVVDPSGCNDTSDFGTPSFVILSHSTGALVTDAAMHAAATYPNLNAAFIPAQCKAHVAPSGAFLGSHMATAAVLLSGYAPQPVVWAACPVARLAFQFLEPGPLLPGCTGGFPDLKDFAETMVKNSVLVDLVPHNAQVRWGPSIANSPVRTITAVAGHPSKNKPGKFWLHRGVDDGVVTINSQTPSPNNVLLGASVYFPDSLRLAFDLGLKKTLGDKKRAKFYYRDQTKDRKLPRDAVASGATRWVSPSGMLAPTTQTTTAGRDPHNRYPNHYTYTQSASSHKAAIRHLDRYPNYEHTEGGDELNWEETRVLTDAAVYAPYAAGMGDIAPLLDAACMAPMREEVRGRMIRFKLKIFTWTFVREVWLWRRHYHLLANARTRHQIDYLHESVLCHPVDCTPPTCDPSPDFNGDGLVNGADLATLLGAWGQKGSGGDLDGDGIVSGSDLSILLGAWTGG